MRYRDGISDGTISTISDANRRRRPAGRRADVLVLVSECDRPLAGSTRHLLDGVDEVVIARGQRRAFERVVVDGGVRRLMLWVPDQRVSTTHARLRRDGRAWIFEDAASKNGSAVNGVRSARTLLGDGDIIECGRVFFRYRTQQEWSPDQPLDLESDRLAPGALPGLTTFDEPLAQQLGAVRDVARTTLPVLILGPSGSGKELIARAVHAFSSRPGPYVAVNCGALPENLVEAELFGSRKGAFTGATDNRDGLVRSSHQGTLLLDEIGDLAPRAQPALLRVLQEREVMAVGTTRALPVDLRVVAATHRDLDALVEASQFRADLLARLSAFVVRLPPLSQRLDDLGILVAALIRRHAAPQMTPTVSTEAMRVLLRYAWPLNIRELEHALSAALTLSPLRIEAEHLSRTIRDGAAAQPPAMTPSLQPPASLTPEQRALREQLVGLLTEHRGNISQVARLLGKDRVQIRRWIRLYRIDVAELKG